MIQMPISLQHIQKRKASLREERSYLKVQYRDFKYVGVIFFAVDMIWCGDLMNFCSIGLLKSV